MPTSRARVRIKLFIPWLEHSRFYNWRLPLVAVEGVVTYTQKFYLFIYLFIFDLLLVLLKRLHHN